MSKSAIPYVDGELFNCPLVEKIICDGACYDIQAVSGPIPMVKRSILEDMAKEFDISLVTDERVASFCTNCPFNQLPA